MFLSIILGALAAITRQEMTDRQEEEAKYQGVACIYENWVSNPWELISWRLMDFTSRLGGGKSYVGMPRNPITFATAKYYSTCGSRDLP